MQTTPIGVTLVGVIVVLAALAVSVLVPLAALVVALRAGRRQARGVELAASDYGLRSKPSARLTG